MWSEAPTDWMSPTVKIYALGCVEDFAPIKILYTRESDFRLGEENFRDLNFFFGDSSKPTDISAAIGWVNKVKNSRALNVLVLKGDGNDLERNSSTPNGRVLDELIQAFNCIFFIGASEAHLVAERIAKTIAVLGGAGQASCCDWNDLRAIVDCQTNARHGFGCGHGVDRLQLATFAALKSIGTPKFGESIPCNVIVRIQTTRGSPVARYLKDASILIRGRIQPIGYLSGFEYNDSLGSDIVEVDIIRLAYANREGGLLCPTRD